MTRTATYKGCLGPVGVFDSGYGGLSILRQLQNRLPGLSYVYLGDNARAPYGTRGFEQVYRYTLQGVQHLMQAGCPLVILACNTASAKALRTIQQQWLPTSADPTRRVLGVIRPTAEAVRGASKTGHIGLIATPGTVLSKSYDIEIAGQAPEYTVTSRACPMWVPLVEYGFAGSDGADFFVRNDLQALFGADPDIDVLVPGCTHYPHLIDKIRRWSPPGIRILDQGQIVAQSLARYFERHPEIDCRLSRGGTTEYLTTDSAEAFGRTAAQLLGRPVQARTVQLAGENR